LYVNGHAVVTPGVIATAALDGSRRAALWVSVDTRLLFDVAG
jgi:hypothetical protein